MVLFGKVAGENRGPNPMDPPIERTDDLFWLRDDDRKDPKVIAHLKAENAYTETHLAHVQPLAGIGPDPKKFCVHRKSKMCSSKLLFLFSHFFLTSSSTSSSPPLSVGCVLVS